MGSFWDKIQDINSNEFIHRAEEKRKSLAGYLSVLAISFTLFYLLGFWVAGINSAIPLQAGFLAVYIVAWLCNRKGREFLAKFLLTFMLNIHVFILSSVFGKDSQMHSLYIPVVMIPIILFNPRESVKYLFFFASMALIGLFALHVTGYALFKAEQIQEDLLDLFDLVIKLTTLLSGIIIVYTLVVLYEGFERKMDKDKRFLQNQLQSVFDHSHDALFLIDWNIRRMVKVNKRAMELFEVEKEDWFYSFSGMQLHADPLSEEEQKRLQETILENKVYKNEFLYRTSRGNTFWGSVAVKLIQIDEQDFQIARLTDITDKKKADEQIRSSLKEKEILLSEVHHRVKNNLAIISGLLTLQEQYITDPKAIEVFEETKGRIHTMALIHNKLYQNNLFSNINFGEYLQDMVQMIEKSSFNSSVFIQYAMDCSPVSLDLKTAIPCGLIVNELITNAVKHAFEGRKEGVISIVLKRKEELVFLQIADNGVGLPAPVNLAEAETMGLSLIYALCDQIDAKVTMETQNGCKVQLEFKA